MISDYCRVSTATRNTLLGAATLAFLGFALFAPHWRGNGTLIGDHDRLNTFLNVRKHAVDSFREQGRVSTWNDRMFCGYCTSGLHWMVPELDPFTYLQSRLPQRSLFRVCGYISCFFLICAGWSFFALARHFDLRVFPSVVGAGLYMMGSFSVNRILQVDWAHAVLTAMPLGMLILKRIRSGNGFASFLSCTALSVFLIVFTFLQEVAYVFILFGLFAVYQSYNRKNSAPTLIFGTSFAFACMLSLPRLITVAEEFDLIYRSQSLQTTSTDEFLRWFADGIFGRNPEEARSLGNHNNLHEGFQSCSTTLAALLLVVGAMRFGDWPALATRLIFFGVVSAFFWHIDEETSRATWLLLSSYVIVVLSTERWRLFSAFVTLALGLGLAWFDRTAPHRILAAYFILLALGLAWKRPNPASNNFNHKDAAFFYAVFSLCMAVVLLPTARLLIHKLFFNFDFSHSRFIVAALVPMNLLVAHLLQGLFPGPIMEVLPTSGGKFKNAPKLSWTSLGLVGVFGCAALGCLVYGPDTCEQAVAAANFLLPSNQQLCAREVVHVLIAISLFVFFAVSWSVARGSNLPRALVYGFGMLLLGHCFTNAYFQMAGPQTKTYPCVFHEQNYTIVPSAVLQVPAPKVLYDIREKLETDSFRTAFVADYKDVFCFVEPHMADFWHLRVLGGYAAGVPKRLAGLPWPHNARQLRSLTFSDVGMIDWQLLAFLNTKYVICFDNNLYCNVNDANGGVEPGYDVSQMKVLVNPIDVTPRLFFAKRITPHLASNALLQKGRLAKPRLHVTINDAKSMTVTWYHPNDDALTTVELKEASDSDFRLVGRGLARGFMDINMLAEGDYTFRAVAKSRETESAVSDDFHLNIGVVDIAQPRGLNVECIDGARIRLTWDNDADGTCILEAADGVSRVFSQIQEGVQSPLIISRNDPGAVGFRLRKVKGSKSSAHTMPYWLPPTGVTQEALASFSAHLPADPRLETTVEGIEEARSFSDRGTVKASFQGDRIAIEVDRANADRFLVLNELYHPRWRARCDGQEAKIFPANTCMRGLIVPSGTTHIDLEFVPFSHSANALGYLGVCACLGLLAAVAWSQRRRPKPTCNPPHFHVSHRRGGTSYVTHASDRA